MEHLPNPCGRASWRQRTERVATPKLSSAKGKYRSAPRSGDISGRAGQRRAALQTPLRRPTPPLPAGKCSENLRRHPARCTHRSPPATAPAAPSRAAWAWEDAGGNTPLAAPWGAACSGPPWARRGGGCGGSAGGFSGVRESISDGDPMKSPGAREPSDADAQRGAGLAAPAAVTLTLAAPRGPLDVPSGSDTANGFSGNESRGGDESALRGVGGVRRKAACPSQSRGVAAPGSRQDERQRVLPGPAGSPCAGRPGPW